MLEETPLFADRSRRYSIASLQGSTLMVISCFCFSWMGVAVKFSTATLPVTEVVFFRCLITAVILGVWLKKRGFHLRGENERALIGRSFAGFVAILCNFYALSKIPLADASILVNTAPLFVVLLSVIFLKEQLTGSLFLLLSISFVGVFLVLKPSFNWASLASLAGVAAGFFGAVAFVTIRHLHTTDSSLTIAFYFTTIASLGSLPFMLTDFHLPTVPERWGLLAAGIAGTLGQVLMTEAYRHEKASTVSALIYTSVLFSFFWGILFFNETPNRFSVLGSLLIIAPAVAIILSQKRPEEVKNR